MVEDEEPDQILRMKILAKLTYQRQTQKLKSESLGEERVQRSMSRVWSRKEFLSVDGIRTKPGTG